MDKEGKDIALELRDGKNIKNNGDYVLSIKNPAEKFEFINVKQEPIPSLLRHFSAPVKLNYNYSDEQLAFLAAQDKDNFNRWDAGQTLLTKIMLELIDSYQNQRPLTLKNSVVELFKQILSNKNNDETFISQALILPTESYLIEHMPIADVDAIHTAREFMKIELAKQLRSLFLERYQNSIPTQAYYYNAKNIGPRKIKNIALSYLMLLNEVDIRTLCLQQFNDSDNMSDVMGALQALIDIPCGERDTALTRFYEKWQKEDLVVDKWYALQAMSSLPNALETVKELMQHPSFNVQNPNRARALIGSFCACNHIHFHSADGAGYEFLTEQILKIDNFNPQLAARLIEPLTRMRKFDSQRQNLMRKQLEKIATIPTLSKDLYEIVTKTLA